MNIPLYIYQRFTQEKGYRDYGHDIDNTDTILECGLGFTCDFDKPIPFIGQSHVEKQKKSALEQGGLRKRLVQVFLNDSHPLLHGGEVLKRNGKGIAEIRSGSYGHSLGGAVGLAMVESVDEPITRSSLSSGDWEVEVADRRWKCEVSLTPFYDPKGKKIR